MRRWFLTAVRVLFALLLAPLRLFFAPIQPYRPPEADRPPARTPAPCGIPALEIPRQAGQLSLQNITGGAFWADEILISGINTLDRSLVVVAESRLVVDGRVGILPQALGDPVIQIVLACRQGNVELLQGSVVSGGAQAAPGESAPATPVTPGRSLAKAGGNSGDVVIAGYRIIVDGIILGGNGGPGGDAHATGDPSPSGTRKGSALAVGGCGGHGGDVVLCAREFIRIEPAARIEGGAAGSGGRGQTEAGMYGDAYARGGDAGNAGDIRFEGHGGLCWVTVATGVQVSAACIPGILVRDRRNGGDAVAQRDFNDRNVDGEGGYAWASAGTGSKGGEIKFVNCRVENRGTLRSGDGGHGGTAYAAGGRGWSDPRQGRNGGDARAHGGAGGSAPLEPQFQNTNGQPSRGTAGSWGWGGDAWAEGGPGGSCQAGGSGGGRSGESWARGGANGDGQLPPHREAASASPTGWTGGNGTQVVARGQD